MLVSFYEAGYLRKAQNGQMRRDAVLGYDLEHGLNFLRTSDIAAFYGELMEYHSFRVELPAIFWQSKRNHDTPVAQLLKTPGVGWYRICAYYDARETFA